MLRALLRLPLWASAGVWWAVTALGASAQTADPNYEQQRVLQHMAASGLRGDLAPDGKRVRRILLVRREVFEGDDLLVPVVLPAFASTWPNYFHHLTEESTIRRELLVREGEPFRAALADESVRNLRGLGIFSLVRIVALATDQPDSVDVLVYTRDLWSLRFEQEFSGAGESFELAAQLVERNFLGRDKSLATRFSLTPDIYTIGQTFVDPRVFGEAFALTESFDVIVNRDSGSPEGSTGGLYFGKPFYSLAQRFSFELNFAYADFVWRDLRNGELLGYDANPGETHGQACVVGRENCLPLVWDESRLRIDGAVHHRVGVRYTQTFSAGAGYLSNDATPNEETAALTRAQRRVFADEVLPESRRDVYPFVRYRLSLPRYVVFKNLGTFAHDENVQIGPRLDAIASVPLELLGSTRDGLSLHGVAAYVWAGSDTLIDMLGEGWSRLDAGNVVDQRLVLRLRAASPSWSWLWGRLVVRAYWDVRQNDSQRALVVLGGDNGLRGYPAQFLYGRSANRVLWNIEYRTRPLLVQSIHLGFVAFYDAGSVYRSVASLRLWHAIGAGVRVLFPQFNPYVFQLDVGQPIGARGFSVLLTYGSDQVVTLTPGEDAQVTTGLGPSLR